MDLLITGYKLQLNASLDTVLGYFLICQAVSDDISFIESQNRGLQVQTSNQQALLTEMRQLLASLVWLACGKRLTISKSSKCRMRTSGYWRKSRHPPRRVSKLLSELQRASTKHSKPARILVSSITLPGIVADCVANAEVAATIARMREYQEQSLQFCKRMSDFLDGVMRQQVSRLIRTRS